MVQRAAKHFDFECCIIIKQKAPDPKAENKWQIHQLSIRLTIAGSGKCHSCFLPYQPDTDFPM